MSPVSTPETKSCSAHGMVREDVSGELDAPSFGVPLWRVNRCRAPTRSAGTWWSGRPQTFPSPFPGAAAWRGARCQGAGSGLRPASSSFPRPVLRLNRDEDAPIGLGGALPTARGPGTQTRPGAVHASVPRCPLEATRSGSGIQGSPRGRAREAVCEGGVLQV